MCEPDTGKHCVSRGRLAPVTSENSGDTQLQETTFLKSMQLEDTEPDLFREKNACRRSVGAQERSSETESFGPVDRPHLQHAVRVFFSPNLLHR